MGLVAEFGISCPALPLVDVAAAVPEAMLVLDLQFNHGNRPLFLATVTGASQRVVEDALTEAYDVGEWTFIGVADETYRYQIVPALSFEAQLGGQIDDLSGLEALATADAVIERIEVEPTGWRQMGWFASRDAFSEFSSFWQRHSEFSLYRLTVDGEAESPGDGLTDRQHEALRVAFELGYFEIPRRTSLQQIATELDISASSVSERLRRAQTKLIHETVATTWPPLPESR
ncbi:bacterio-opsin activator HTH domain-containing protein [Halogeometricum pallidum JCM 14848]|uniref:Bacterio-opsin activator HTH domain-containing protein n=1 Tax=Halogeometricum pallidum JCM 14848 TaxID=1227487 RepID=M0CYU7_HALPD|nr:helix-turn-helix domain-containing protein [Halogeometricum pallidum]ELZ27044.1 bacterio-opsin activator HTH domain-containing protein [Halogeometricum pallidum JCM 14848]